MGFGNVRNAPCWCGSGKKFKYCHLGRAEQPEFKIQDAKKELSRLYTRACLHPEAPSGCVPPIVQAHTVPKRGTLIHIADGGHVYSTLRDLGGILKTGGLLRPTPVGINKASTFTGFCSYHDSTTFRPLETMAFAGAPEQLLLLSYRAVAYEVYKKRVLAGAMNIVRNADRGRSLRDQVHVQRLADAYAPGVDLGFRDLQFHKGRLDAALAARDFAGVRGYVVRLSEAPTVTCSTAVMPEFDFVGRRLQDLSNANEIMDLITLSSIATDDGGGALVFSWLGPQPACIALCESLDGISDGRIASALVRFMYEFAENLYWSIPWWDALPEPIKYHLTKRMNSGLSLGGEHVASCLVEDGRELVTWMVSNRVRVGASA